MDTAARQGRRAIDLTLNIILLIFVTATGIAAVWLRNLLASTMVLGIYSLLMAALWVVLDAVDVAFLGHLANPILFAGGIAMDVRHHEIRAVAVLRRRTAVEVTQYAGHSISFATRPREATFPTIGIAVKSKAAAQVGDVINKFFDRIFFILQRRGDAEAVAAGEKANNAPAPRRCPRHESKQISLRPRYSWPKPDDKFHEMLKTLIKYSRLISPGGDIKTP